MRIGLTLEALGYRETTGRFARRSQVLETERRALIRNAGRTFTEALARRAPKRTGEFARGLFYRTYDRGYTSEARFYAGGKHAFVLPFLIHGTRPHTIPTGGSAAQMAKGYPLTFYWEKGPAGKGWYSFWSVQHPGTKPSPFVDEAYREIGPQLKSDLQKVAVRVAWL